VDDLEPPLGHNAAVDLERRVDRRFTLAAEIEEAQQQLKDFKAEDKADGYDEKAIAQIIREKKKGAKYQAAQLQLELVLTTYRKGVKLPHTLTEAQKRVAEESAEAPDPEAKNKRARATRKDIN
jgi:uncharacterized protein (UPF0335 family)